MSIKKDRILVVLGYHSEELSYGESVRDEFQRRGHDEEFNLSFLTIKDSPVKTGYDSPYSNQLVSSEVDRLGDVGFLVDMHIHPYGGFSDEFSTYDHNPMFFTSDEKLAKRFDSVFENSKNCGHLGESKLGDIENYVIFDPDVFGPDSISPEEAYEMIAPKTVDSLYKLCRVFSEGDISDLTEKEVIIIEKRKKDQFQINNHQSNSLVKLGEYCEDNISGDMEYPIFKDKNLTNDVEMAINWCYEKSQINNSSTQYFVSALEDLQKGKVRYDIEEMEGVHINLIQSWAKAYHEKHNL